MLLWKSSPAPSLFSQKTKQKQSNKKNANLNAVHLDLVPCCIIKNYMEGSWKMSWDCPFLCELWDPS